MRIITGRNKGRKLQFPPGIRPTRSLVRKAIFDVLSGAIEGSTVLELFAGCGAIGIEALSLGAKEVTFVDNSALPLKAIEENVLALGEFSARWHILRKDSIDAVSFLANKGLSYDFIFADPPYGKDLAKNSLIKVTSHVTILKKSGFLVIEHHIKEELPNISGSLTLYKAKRYGQTVVSFYTAYWKA